MIRLTRMPRLVPVVLSLLSICCAAHSTELRLTPIAMREPGGGHWDVIERTDTAITFKLAQPGTDTFLARAALFHVLDEYKPEGFISEVRQNIQTQLGSVASASIEPLTSKPYPCIKAAAAVNVPVKSGASEVATRTVQYRLRICRLPVAMNFGFSATYTYTGDVPVEANDALQTSF